MSVLGRLSAGAACAASGLAFWPLFGAAVVLPVLVAATVPTVLALVTRLRPYVAPISLLLLVPVAAVTLAGTATGGVRREVLGGLGDGIGRLLASTPPVTPRAGVLVVPFALTWIAATAAAVLSGRSRGLLLPVLPALLPFGVAVPLASGGPRPPSPIPALLLAVTLAGALLARRRAISATVHGRGGWVVALLVPFVAAGIAVPAAGVPAGRPRVDPRDHLATPALALAGRDPLDDVPAWLGTPDMPLLTVRGAVTGRLRLAELDRFDGVNWSSTAVYRQTAGGTGTTAVRVTISGLRGMALPAPEGTATVEGLGGMGLPAPEGTATVDGLGGMGLPGSAGMGAVEDRTDVCAIDRDRGLLISVTPVRAGFTYRVGTVRPAKPVGVAGPEARELPAGTPDGLLRLADEITAADADPARRAAMLAERLRGLANRPLTGPGHSFGRLATVLAERAGSAEQIPAVFALAARRMGLASRVVVGFAVPPGTDDRVVRAADLSVWPEVSLPGAGWTAFEVLGRADRTAAGATPPVFGPMPSPSTPPAADVLARASASAGPPASDGRAGMPRGAGPAVPLIAAVVTVFAAGTAGGWWLTSRIRARQRRRRRRGSRDPATRVAGALADCLETLARAGYRAGPGETHRDLYFGANHRYAGTPGWPAALNELHQLTALLDRALFGPAAPGDREATNAWAHADRLRTSHLAKRRDR